jgi:Flp pilus assembly pilin Flp
VQFIKNFIREEEGQDAVEYALVVGLVAVAGAVALGALTGQIDGLVTAVGTLITDALP